jgi:hypothetical protein
MAAIQDGGLLGAKQSGNQSKSVTGVSVVSVGRVYGANSAVRHHPHRTHNLRCGSQDHHPSKMSVQKTICCNSTSNVPDNGRMYLKHAELKLLIKLHCCIKLTFHITLETILLLAFSVLPPRFDTTHIVRQNVSKMSACSGRCTIRKRIRPTYGSKQSPHCDRVGIYHLSTITMEIYERERSLKIKRTYKYNLVEQKSL